MQQKRSVARPVSIAIAAIAVGTGLWYGLDRRQEAPPPAPPPLSAPAAPASARASAEPAIAHPLAGAPPPEAAMQAPAQPPADALDAFRSDLEALGDAAVLARFIDPASLVRRVVSTVDNVTADELPMRARAFAATPGAFAVTRDGGAIVVDPANARRYAPFVAWIESIDTKRAVALYVKHYALFQGEYRGQGNPGRYFNDRLVAAIDHLLATPEPPARIELVQPKVLYRYADPSLETLSAAQKALLRMGPENGARIRTTLRSVRAEVSRQGAGR
jgi:hypothetical protein